MPYCEDRRRLEERECEDFRVYVEAMSVWANERNGSGRQAAFERMRIAREAFDTSRDLVADHIALHGCR